MKFRLFLQPTMAAIFAVRAGLADARLGKPPYLWSLFSGRAHLVQRLADGWKDVGKVFVLALVLDAVYQGVTTGFRFPGEALIVAVALALVPYLVLRGAVTRVVRRK